MVTVGCLCPPKATGEVRHATGDTIELRERLDFRSALTARNTFAMMKQEDPDTSAAEILAALTEVYLLLGIASWSVVDGKGKPVEPNKAAIREYLLSKPDVAMTVGDAADELYSEAVITPLVVRAQNSSLPSPTNGSISATNGSHPKPRKPSKPSSTTTTPMEDTETITPSPGGDSRSSPNSA